MRRVSSISVEAGELSRREGSRWDDGNQPRDPTRRRAVTLMGGGIGAVLTGCCALRGFPKPQIDETGLASAAREASTAKFLAPRTFNTTGVPTTSCVDVHAHFFNASDVTVKGYLEGPVAYSTGGALGDLVRLLAPLGEALAELAPTAKAEYDSLQTLSTARIDPAALRSSLGEQTQKERQSISVEFNRLVRSSSKGRKFLAAYEHIMQPASNAGSRVEPEARTRIRSLEDDSVFKAMSISEAPVDEPTLRTLASSDRAPYAEGILAFVGYMLSARRSNLMTYQAAFTEEGSTIGVRRALGLMVDFDHWLECPPRSAHEDQMKLHLKLSQLSDGYMLPVISYNPWTDVVTKGRSLELVETAIKSGFVAVKIYPPNGFRAWGNTGLKEPHGAPTGAKLDAALQRFWLKCRELQVPVIAHAGPSMGSDAAHIAFAGPEGWEALLEAPFWTGNAGPQVSLGHFGGDSDWTPSFARLMGKPRGGRVYADLAYWDELQCTTAGTESCEKAKALLASVLRESLGNGQSVADRLMYGSDWLMLSREKNWPAYARQLQSALQSIDASYVSRIFGGNAQQCFGVRLGLA